MLKFNLYNLQIIVSFGFVFAICAFSMLTGFDFVCKLGFSCLIHEVGHFIAISLCKAKILKLRLSVNGISINAQIPDDKDKLKRIIIASSGPFFSLISFFIFAFFDVHISKICLIIAIYSLIPLDGFDGGDITDSLYPLNSRQKQIIIFIYIIFAISFAVRISTDNITLFFVIIYITALRLFSDEQSVS